MKIQNTSSSVTNEVTHKKTKKSAPKVGRTKKCVPTPSIIYYPWHTPLAQDTDYLSTPSTYLLHIKRLQKPIKYRVHPVTHGYGVLRLVQHIESSNSINWRQDDGTKMDLPSHLWTMRHRLGYMELMKPYATLHWRKHKNRDTYMYQRKNFLSL